MDNHNNNTNKKCFSIFNISIKKDSKKNDEPRDEQREQLHNVDSLCASSSSLPDYIAPVVSSITVTVDSQNLNQLNPNSECDFGTLETGPVQPILKVCIYTYYYN